MIDEKLYETLLREAWRRFDLATRDCDPDVLDCESTEGRFLMKSAAGSSVIITPQRPVRQIWVATRGQGLHFSFDEEAKEWKDDKGKGLELFSFLNQAVQDASGEELEF